MKLPPVLLRTTTLAIAFCVTDLFQLAISAPVNSSRCEEVPSALSLNEHNAFLDRHFLDKIGKHPKKERRQARTYNTKNVVECLDSLSNSKNRPIHIAFVGDSLVRQHFLSFLEVSFVSYEM